MKKMCMVMLAAVVIIICVIAFQTLKESREKAYDGIMVEECAGRIRV